MKPIDTNDPQHSSTASDAPAGADVRPLSNREALALARERAATEHEVHTTHEAREAYRTARRLDEDEPPASLDDAIRAAARREVNAKPHLYEQSWFTRNRVRLSAAAVIVLSASVISVMQFERPDAFTADVPAPRAKESKEFREPSADRAVAVSIAPPTEPTAAPRPTSTPVEPDRVAADKMLEMRVAPAAPAASAASAPAPAREAEIAKPPLGANVASDKVLADAKRRANVAAPAPQVFVPPPPAPPAPAAPPAPVALQKSVPPVETASAPAPVVADVAPGTRASNAAPPAPAKSVVAERAEVAAPPAPPARSSFSPSAQAGAPTAALVIESPESWIMRLLAMQQANDPKLVNELRRFKNAYPRVALPKSLADVDTKEEAKAPANAPK
jgi:hypothetical protein